MSNESSLSSSGGGGVRAQCSNTCGKVFETREEMDIHLSKECPLEVVDCDFKHIGCEVRLPRRALPTHLGQAVVIHLSQQAEVYQERMKMLEEDNERLAIKCKRLETEQAEITKKMDEVLITLKSLSTRNNSNNPRSVSCKRHQYANADRSLSYEDRRTMHTPLCINSEMPSLMTVQRAPMPLSKSVASFSSDELLSEADNERYINADTIHEAMKKVDYSYVFTSKSQSSSPVPDTQSSSRTRVTMTGFERHQLSDDNWISQPFFTHAQGYKMCLRVTANGQGGGKGTHITVGVYLMKGEFDNQLEWPFRGDITIKLLNQAGRGEHHCRTICGAVGERGEASEGERFISAWCISQFKSLSEISPRYLQDDSLVFQVSTVTVVQHTQPTASALIETEV